MAPSGMLNLEKMTEIKVASGEVMANLHNLLPSGRMSVLPEFSNVKSTECTIPTLKGVPFSVTASSARSLSASTAGMSTWSMFNAMLLWVKL